MKVKLKTCMAGPEGTFYPGQIVEDKDGSLVKGGYAESVEDKTEEKPPETWMNKLTTGNVPEMKSQPVKPPKKGR